MPFTSVLWVGSDKVEFELFAAYLNRAPTRTANTKLDDSVRAVDFHGGRNQSLVCASSDDRLDLELFVDQCVNASVILVAFNAAQPSSGLNSLMRDSRLPFLREFAAKVVFVSIDGAAFDHHLQDLPLEVVSMVRQHAGFQLQPWYVCDVDRYDARYSDYINLCDLVLRSGGSARDLIRYWRDQRVSMHAPFTERALELSFAGRVVRGIE